MMASDDSLLKKRGRAYSCRKCSYVGGPADATWHYVKSHVDLKHVPFHCSLCQYRAKDLKALKKHISTWKPHVIEAKKQDHNPIAEDCLMEAATPYKVQCTEDPEAEADLLILSAKASTDVWASRQVKAKGKTKRERDLDYALSILKDQGYNINQEDKSLTATSVTSAEPATPSTSLPSPEPTPTAPKTPEPAPTGPVSQEMEEEGVIVISADCGRLTDDSISSSSSLSEDNEPQLAEPTKIQPEPEPSISTQPLLLQLDQREVVSTMAEVVKATLEHACERMTKACVSETDMYSAITTLGKNMLNTNCNLADVVESLDRCASKSSDQKEELQKLNRQTWELRGEVGKMNSNIANVTKAVDSLHSSIKAQNVKLTSLVETLISSQQTLAASLTNQTQALKRLHSPVEAPKMSPRKERKEDQRPRRERVGVSPLRALNGFDELYRDCKRKGSEDHYHHHQDKRQRRH